MQRTQAKGVLGILEAECSLPEPFIYPILKNDEMIGVSAEWDIPNGDVVIEFPFSKQDLLVAEIVTDDNDYLVIFEPESVFSVVSLGKKLASFFGVGE